MGITGHIDGIRVFAELGRGASQTIYKGFQSVPGRFVLVKILDGPDVAEDRIRQFFTEARALARVQHPNVVSVYSYGRHNGQPYLTTEFVDGVDLQQLLNRGPIPIPLSVYIAKQLLAGIAAVHASGIVHHDVKPANVLISTTGSVKLADFGLASIGSSPDSPRGTIAYMAPEEIRGEVSRSASDYFALGVCLFEMVEGFTPFRGTSESEVMKAIVGTNPFSNLPLESSEINDVICKLLTKDPNERLQDFDHDAAFEAILSQYYPVPDAPQLSQYIENRDTYVTSTKRSELARNENSSSERSVQNGGSQRGRSRFGLRLGFGVISLGLIVLFTSYVLKLIDTPQTSGPQTSGLEIRRPDAVERSELPSISPDGRSVQAVQDDYQPGTSNQTESEPQDTDVTSLYSGQNSGDQTETLATVTSESHSIETDRNTGVLSIMSSPWAEVALDSEEIGTTPFAVDDIQVGEHKLAFAHPLFPEIVVAVEIAAGDTVNLDVSLWDYVGSVYVEVSPWAELIVAGTLRDTIPPQREPIILVPGVYPVILRHPLGDYKSSWSIEAGSTYTKTYNLFDLINS